MLQLESVKREYEVREETFSSTEKRMMQSNEDSRVCTFSAPLPFSSLLPSSSLIHQIYMQRLLEVIRKQEKLIEELQEAAEQSNAQKLNNFQQTQSIHKTNKMQIAKLQEEVSTLSLSLHLPPSFLPSSSIFYLLSYVQLQRLVDDNNALHKVMAEEQAIFSKEV